MKGFSIRFPEDELETLDAEADEQNLSRSEYVRELFRNRDGDSDELAELRDELERLREKHKQLQDEYERSQNERERLNRKLTAALELKEENDELVEYVEHEREVQKRREHSPIWTRAKWWVLGRPEKSAD
ncbi:plasmid mobilization protein [Haladaptatus halobius]|uniref:plasmid mobilization protein n=1 Tax=Haladaptatus halobius TaxID=2884875 RepID=UPI001D09D31E|nr:ribbon-helix-helix protein, CopG family [Haladaptatus halobius]